MSFEDSTLAQCRPLHNRTALNRRRVCLLQLESIDGLMVAFWEDAGVLRLNAKDEGIKLVQHAMSDNALVNFILLWYFCMRNFLSR